MVKLDNKHEGITVCDLQQKKVLLSEANHRVDRLNWTRYERNKLNLEQNTIFLGLDTVVEFSEIVALDVGVHP